MIKLFVQVALCAAGLVQAARGVSLRAEVTASLVGECPPTMLFSECPSACPKICGQPEVGCIMSCAPPGCTCPTGLWLKEASSECVPEEECALEKVQPIPPKGCVMSECAPAPACRKTCGKDLKGVFCAAVCEQACVCPEGLWLHEGKNKCVKKNKCSTPSDEY